ncbi:M23 family metallopeptidase [Microbacterium sp. 16-032]|uniref:M23 family metallopeptidase n=1 Tax=Microbacterium sp. 16-032 TaxID=3239808 RepID=UPI0034E19988
MGYITPCDASITDTWQGHKNRNPPSQEPGTDYGAARGTPVRCAEAGTVVDLQSSPSGATGRYVTVNLDDGRRVRYLHLSQVTVGVGARVSRGQTIALSGASGFGSETGYGAHVHVSLWSSPGQSISNTIDFQLYVGNATTPPQEEDDMFNEDDRNLLRNASNARKPFVRIQSTNRGIALIGPNYFRGLAPSELTASASLISEHFSLSDADWDIFKAIAIGGETADLGPIRTEARPLKLYRYKGNLIVIGPGGKQWNVPSDAYRVLLQAVGLVGDVTRDLGSGDNELNFIKQVLESVSPDPATSAQTARVMSIKQSDAEKLAATIEGDRA